MKRGGEASPLGIPVAFCSGESDGDEGLVMIMTGCAALQANGVAPPYIFDVDQS